jgi:DivIVA domain-containing protein
LKKVLEVTAMALTPEDVVNKRFQPTKFREGYDQDEVDDFLDEVVVELRRLNQENEELRQRLVQSDQRVNQLQQGGQAPAPAMAAPMAAPMAPPMAAPAPAQSAYPAQGADEGNTNNLLQLARTLHEQHVREGIEKRDALIAEGHAAAAMAVQQAEAQQRAQIGGLEQERQQLEYRIEELRNFERDYRAKLKGYIEGQLRDLESASVAAPAQPQQAQQQPNPVMTGQQSPLLTGQQQPNPLLTGQQPPAPNFGGMPPQGMPPQGMPQQVPQGYPGFGGN